MKIDLKLTPFMLILVIGSVILSILFFYADYFYLERLYGDASYYIFKLVNHNRINIEHNRPVSFFIQVIPKYLVSQNYSLSCVLKWFSLNEWLYFVVCFFIMIFLLKDHFGAIGVLLAVIIGSRWNYFNPVSELILAIPFVFILYSIIIKNNINFIQFIIALFSGIMAILSHPLYFIFIPAILLLGWISRIDKTHFSFLLIVSVIMIVNILHYLQLDQYEMETMSQPLELPWHSILEFNYAKFISFIFPLYLGWIIILTISSIQLIRYKHYILLTYLLFCVSFFFGLVMYKFGELYQERYEPFERFMILVPLFICVVFSYHIVPTIGKLSMLILYIIIPAYHLYLLFDYGSEVRLRTEHIFRVIEYAHQFKEDKITFRSSNFFPHRYGQDYTLNMESMLFSSIEDCNKTKQITVTELYNSEFLSNAKTDFYIYAPGSTWEEEIYELNPKYFKMESSRVRFSNTDSVQSRLPESIGKKFNVEFIKLDKVEEKSALCLLKITNLSGTPLFSGQNAEGIKFITELRSENLETRQGFMTPIVGDIYTSLIQHVNIQVPKIREKSTYQLKIYFSNGMELIIGEPFDVVY